MQYDWDRDLDSKIRDISVMYEIAYSIGLSSDIKKEANNFLDKVLKRFGFEVGSLLVRDIENDKFNLVAAKGFMDSQKIVGLKLSFNEYGIGDVIEKNEPIIKNSLSQKDREWIIAHELQPRIGSYAFFPIPFGGEVIGILRLFSYREDAFSPKFIRMLNPLLNRLGSALHHILTIENYQRSERALFVEKEYLSVILHSISEGVIVTDTEGRVTLINKAAEKITGWTADKVVGMPLMQFFNIDKDRDIVKDVINKGSGEVIPDPFILVSKDNIKRNIEISSAPLKNKKGDIYGVVIVFRDITEKIIINKEVEELRADRLESIGILAAGIAHDFNNILTAVLGNISLAMNLAEPESKIYKELKKARKATEAATQLAGQLLAFSKGGAPQLATTSLGGLIKDTISFTLRGSSIVCDFNIPDNLWFVDIDRGQISQVIQNLVINSMQAISERGIIVVKAENIIIERDTQHLKKGKYVEISVKDNGKGIPPEYLSKIFIPYFTTKEKGTGLGLATTYAIIKRHNGHIAVESEVGVGTTFHIWLPASEKQMLKETKDIQHIDIDEKKILVVDDEMIIRETVKALLEHIGCKVETAGNSDEAIELYKKAKKDGNPFDVVILDLIIQGSIGGEEIIKKLFEIDPEVTAIVSSGYSDGEIMAEFKKYGFKGALAKPYTLEMLKEALVKATSKI